jgi:hypothetical protein
MGGSSENPYAGQGPVLLDIGDDMGALVVVMPAGTEGLEVELRPAGATAHGHGHPHGVAGAHHHGPDGTHVVGDHPAYPHVAVVARPDRDGVVHTLVYPSVTEGEYELYVLPSGPVAMTASVTGGQVTQHRWSA